MRAVGISRFLLILRPSVAAGVIAVLAASILSLLLRRKLVKNALQIRVIRINAGIHNTDRASRVYRGIRVLPPFLPAGHLHSVSGGR